MMTGVKMIKQLNKRKPKNWLISSRKESKHPKCMISRETLTRRHILKKPCTLGRFQDKTRKEIQQFSSDLMRRLSMIWPTRIIGCIT